jgi:aminoglycoside/choline kinase family phosphotransferase
MKRKQALLAWTQTVLNDTECYVKPASNDASFRSYWRVFSKLHTYIIMDAPIEHEDCIPFIDISQRLEKCGLQAPKVIAHDLTQGFLLLSDLGTVQYLSILNKDNYKSLYQDAIKSIHTMQQKTVKSGLPLYDHNLLNAEMDLFDQWFIKKHLGISLSTKQSNTLGNTKKLLIDNALKQPQSFVHRDFHSRNLMKTEKSNPGILDFQDAIIGPITYDLVSLLRDCYVSWNESIVQQLADEFRLEYNQLNHDNIEPEQWFRWFDFMGIQRHLKAIGIFCRLNYRDQKSNYLKDINRTLKYIKCTGNKYKELGDFLDLISEITPNMDLICEH